MAGRNFGLTNIYLKLGLGMMLLGRRSSRWGCCSGRAWASSHGWPASPRAVPGGVVVYVIGRIAKAIAEVRSSH